MAEKQIATKTISQEANMLFFIMTNVGEGMGAVYLKRRKYYE